MILHIISLKLMKKVLLNLINIYCITKNEYFCQENSRLSLVVLYNY